MKWLERTTHNLYSTRKRHGFLLLPKKAFLRGVGYQWRWLEYAWWEDEYESGGLGWRPHYWEEASHDTP